MLKQFGQSIWQGLKRRKLQGISAGFTGLGLLWLLTEIIMAFSPEMKAGLEANPLGYGILASTIALAFSFRAIYEPRSVKFALPMTNTQVVICYGDLFETPDDMLIAVNEFFDGRLGQVIARTSVHGGFIERFFNSDEARFRAEVDAALSHAIGTRVQRAIAPAVRYPIGTTARLSIGPRTAYLFALTETAADFKASTTIPYLWSALSAVLTEVHRHCNGRPLALPLIGNGRASLDLPPQSLLRLLTLALADFAKKTGLPPKVTIVLPEDCFDHLDLREIARDWSKR